MRARGAPSCRSGIRGPRLESSRRHDTGTIIVRWRCLAREAPKLLAITAVDAAGFDLRLQEHDPLPVGGLQPGAGQRGRGIQLERVTVAVPGPCRLATELVDGAFL